jgi:hemerythrin HHE cation binding domain-containing protein
LEKATDAFEMALVHAAFRRELDNATRLIENVQVGDTQRSNTVGHRVVFMAEALHHHHAAEDEVIWPKLQARAATRDADVSRMVDTHREIADCIVLVRTTAASWSASADLAWRNNSFSTACHRRTSSVSRQCAATATPRVSAVPAGASSRTTGTRCTARSSQPDRRAAPRR